MADPVGILRSKHDFQGLTAGDQVRLKFLYPSGEVEIVDATWIGVNSLDPSGEGEGHPWVVFRAGEKTVWKPLSLLVQIEVLGKVAGGEGGEANLGQVIQYHG